ncbi:MAG: hypothetical protein RLZZ46_897, partial [Bacteroidota bacterium]
SLEVRGYSSKCRHYRGKIHATGKGEINMYLVVGKQSEIIDEKHIPKKLIGLLLFMITILLFVYLHLLDAALGNIAHTPFVIFL